MLINPLIGVKGMKIASRIISVALCACMAISMAVAASAASENLALGKATIDYGAHQNNHTSDNITDGCNNLADADAAQMPDQSRWAAAQTTDGVTTGEWWVGVDFGEATTFDKLVIYWEACYGKQFKIQTSDNASDWKDVTTVLTNDSANAQEIILDTPANAKYVRIFITEKANQWGVSLFELEVYNTSGEAVPPQTGVESVAIWALVLFGAACITVFCVKKVKA